VRRLAQNLALSAATIIVILIALEVVLTIAGYGDLIIYQPDDTLYWRPKPLQSRHTKVGRHPVTINSHGTRGEEFPAEKPAGTFRVLCVGDSRTFGWGLGDRDTYPAMLQDSLRALVGKARRVEVINAGVNGWSWSQVFCYLRDIGLSYVPDVIVVADAYSYTSFTEDRSPEFVGKMKRRVWVKNLLRRSAVYHYFIEYRFREAYFRLGELVFPADRAAPDPPTTDDPDAVYYEKYINKVCELIHDARIPAILLHLPTEGEDATSRPASWRIKREAAASYGMAFVDVTDPFLSSPTELFLHRDPLHQNATGNRLVAGRLFQRLAAELPR
jgi:lysophospholipase L1-like esterase